MWAWWKKLKRLWVGENALFDAVEYDDIPTIQNLLCDGFDIEAYNRLGYTPLQHSLLHRQYRSTIFLLEQRANPNAPCRSALRETIGKPIQTYLHVGLREPEHFEFAPIMQRNKSLITLLVLYGTTEEGVIFYENQPAVSLFKQIFRESQRLAQEKREQEGLLQEGSPQVRHHACQRLSNLWRQLSEAEPPEYDQGIPLSERLHEILKTHYAEKASFYAEKAWQLAAELKSVSTKTKVAVSRAASQPNCYHHPAHAYMSTAQAEKVPVLCETPVMTPVLSPTKKLI